MVKATRSIPLNKQEVLSRVKETDIFTKYFTKPEYGKHYTNPLRKDDKPGCSFFMGEVGAYKNRLLFHDFAKDTTYDCFQFIMDKYSLTFWETLKKINEDFDLNLGTHYARARIEKDIEEREEIFNEKPLIQAVTRDFTKDELNYWKQFGINRTLLKKFKVYAASQVYINKKLVARSTPTNPIFVYEYEDGIKIYRPLHPDKDKRFFGNILKDTIVGLDQLPFSGGDLLIITSSHKDVMTLSRLGYYSIAPANSETQYIKKAVIDSLSPFWERIVVFYDNDGCFNPPKNISGKGKEAARKLADRYNLEMIFIPDNEPKDISDFYQKYGKKKSKELLNKTLNNGK